MNNSDQLSLLCLTVVRQYEESRETQLEILAILKAIEEKLNKVT